ncbi:APG9-domain-containing protein [Pleurotus eryngii]|uniref:Autophagy-related protein 9 n=1 Tax=Pleurotus eryngii TaxID=5323 RepID=A0A9P6A7B7_PLEER|nr:APG9-domain-containing protein [Pleurotus eryngii]
MSTTSNRSTRRLAGVRQTSSSQSHFGSASLSASSSRAFLNMMNPMARQYQGYTRANESVVEEEETGGSEGEDLEMNGNQTPDAASASRSKGKQRVSWDAGASQMNVLHPNIHKEDKMNEHSGESSDDEVPQSFMIETSSKAPAKSRMKDSAATIGRSRPLHSGPSRHTGPILPVTSATSGTSIPPRPSEIDPPPSTYAQQRSYSTRGAQPNPMRGLDAYERALWNWVNVYSLDAFLQEVYYYYEGKGIYSIALSRGLNLLTVGFVIGFSTFLLGCIDYSIIRHGNPTRLSEAVIDHCVSRFSGFTLLFFILFAAFYLWQILQFVLDVVRLSDMYHFYTYLLKIPDADIQTISWSEIVRRIGAIREENPMLAISSKARRSTNNTSTAKLDAHDIANRIMRQENYLIALFNKELLDLRVPLPDIMKRFGMGEEGKGRVLTKALEWNLRFCLMEYLFDRRGRVRKMFLKSANRATLVEGLRRRFIFMGILNAIFAPFIVPYLLMYSFFRYFEEYHKNPSSIGGRRYTSFAQWKFREFNELPHFFIRRLDESYPIASMYIGQFPNEKLTIIMRFVAFVAGSFAAVLLLATVIDPDLFVHFEITPHRTVLFYLGIFGSVLAVARGMIPEENRVFDPELLMTEVIEYTHYMPDDWKGELHSKKVHQEFGELFAMKILIFAQEILSVILTPFVLWLSLPACAPSIIDFFREFTVHVDGRGFVCSFAEFDFERHGNVKFGAPTKKRDKRWISNEGKMEKSFLNFKATHPEWNPTDPSGSLYLSRMAEYSMNRPHNTQLRRRAVGLETSTLVTPTPERQGEASSLADRAQKYDRALLQSQMAASRRRPGGSILMDPAASSFVGGMDMAQTAVLGDSQGSVHLPEVRGNVPSSTDAMEEEDLDAVSGSGLGGSYVDGARRARRDDAEEEDEDDLDGGVLGLLAEIYGRREGPARAI